MRTKVLTSILGLLLSFSSFAGHEVGGVIISYESVSHVNNNDLEYVLTVYMIYSTGGVPIFPSSATVQQTSSCFANASHTLPRIVGTGFSGLLPLLGSDYCSSASSIQSNYALALYRDTVLLPGTCVDFRFTMSAGFGRYGSMINIASNFNNNYFESWLDNRFGTNSIPDIDINDIIQVACLNKPVSLYGFTEPDGDSIYFNIRAPLHISGTTVGQFAYNSGYTSANPINSSAGFTIDPQTGQIQTEASNIGNFLITVGFREYRRDTANKVILVGNGRYSMVLSGVNSCNAAPFNLTYESVPNSDSLGCSDKEIRMATTRKIASSSVTTSASEFEVTANLSGPLTPISANVISDSIIVLKFAQSLPLGEVFTILAKDGTDSNVVLSICGKELISKGDTLTYYTPASITALAAFTHSASLLNSTFNSSGSFGQSFIWDFGDGSPIQTVTNPSHTYASPGLYVVSLVAVNSCGANDTVTSQIRVCDSLTSNFNTTISADSVHLDAASSVGVSQYFWNFGDGNNGSGVNASHGYSQAGNYIIELITVNLCGDSTSVFDTIKLCEDAMADWTYTIVSTTSTGMLVDFDGTNSVRAQSFTWDFGDGNTNTTTLTPQHNYATPSLTYVVTLTVYNECGDPNIRQFRLDQIGINEDHLSALVDIYPNPSSHTVNIKWPEHDSDLEVYILDQSGGVLLKRTFKEKETASLNISQLPAGAYIIDLRGGDIRAQRLLIIE